MPSTWTEQVKVVVDRTRSIEERLAALQWIDVEMLGDPPTPEEKLEEITDAILESISDL